MESLKTISNSEKLAYINKFIGSAWSFGLGYGVGSHAVLPSFLNRKSYINEETEIKLIYLAKNVIFMIIGGGENP